MSDPTSIKTLSEAERILARALGYQLISALFRHPETREHWLPSLLQVNWLEVVDMWGFSDQKGLKEKIQLILNEFINGDHDKWRRQYENIFGHTACSKVPLYELEYGEEHSYRQPQELADITGFYQAFGLQGSEKVHDRPDHISLESEFVYALLYKKAVALRSNDFENAATCQRAYERFLQEHLAFWLPALTYRMIKFLEPGLLYWFAEFAYAFVTQDCKKQQLKMGSENLLIRPIEEKAETGCVSCQLGPQPTTPES
ncbi:MAG: hypothetical protein A2Z88_08285 [Omnitrophica WOR_2 bacterium GWA2_47_8]|nr:MAG: hypothetical protein A2Z88_08285 [Omnitrophica WOR_2 bacterium GWA2_47_8]